MIQPCISIYSCDPLYIRKHSSTLSSPCWSIHPCNCLPCHTSLHIFQVLCSCIGSWKFTALRHQQLHTLYMELAPSFQHSCTSWYHKKAICLSSIQLSKIVFLYLVQSIQRSIFSGFAYSHTKTTNYTNLFQNIWFLLCFLLCSDFEIYLKRPRCYSLSILSSPKMKYQMWNRRFFWLQTFLENWILASVFLDRLGNYSQYPSNWNTKSSTYTCHHPNTMKANQVTFSYYSSYGIKHPTGPTFFLEWLSTAAFLCRVLSIQAWVCSSSQFDKTTLLPCGNLFLKIGWLI